MIPFLGKFLHTVDEKGRTNVPSKHRDVLKGEPTPHLVLTKGLDGCLFLLPLSAWEKFQARLDQEEFQSEAEARYFEREFLEDGDVLVPDAQGRIQIAKELRSYAHIEREALIVGVRTRIEIWSPAVYGDYKAKAKQESPKSLEQLAGAYWRRH